MGMSSIGDVGTILWESSCEWVERQEAAGQTELLMRHEASTANNLTNV